MMQSHPSLRVALAFRRLSEAAAEVSDAMEEWHEAEAVEPVPTHQHGQRRTVERITLLRELWGQPDITKTDILARVNALPGEAIPRSQLASYASQWGARRPTTEVQEVGARPLSLLLTPREPIPVVHETVDRLSVAARLEAQMDQDNETCPIVLADALEWGRRNGLVRCGELTRDFMAVNEIRRRHQLPLYRLVRQLRPYSPLPHERLDLDGLHQVRRAFTLGSDRSDR